MSKKAEPSKVAYAAPSGLAAYYHPDQTVRFIPSKPSDGVQTFEIARVQNEKPKEKRSQRKLADA